eukprot:8969285-Alexandrium_andersonii.AAC.1
MRPQPIVLPPRHVSDTRAVTSLAAFLESLERQVFGASVRDFIAGLSGYFGIVLFSITTDAASAHIK